MSTSTLDQRSQALSNALAGIERSHGKGAVIRLGSRTAEPVDAIPTGAITLDLALGVGGVPRGRIIEVFGPESSGKTTLGLTILAQAQRQGGLVAFIDAEHALDPEWAARLGVAVDELHIAQPDTGEQALDILEQLVRSGALHAIVVDSVAALVPKAEIDGEMGDSHVGLQARLMSQAMRKLAAAISHSQTTVIFINQIREKVGVMFGSPETTSGGRALKYYASVRLDIRRIDTVKSGQEAIGNRVKVKVVKNKVAAPFRVAEFDILFAEGISAAGSLIDAAVEHGVLSKSGAWLSYGETRLGNGRDAVRDMLRSPEHATLAGEIRERVLSAVRPAGPAAIAPVEQEDQRSTSPRVRPILPALTEEGQPGLGLGLDLAAEG